MAHCRRMTRVLASSPEASARMRQARKEDTQIERKVGRALWSGGVRYRKHVKALAGCPDFANLSKKWAVFVNGCFWHHHTACRRATIPKANRSFWVEKFRRNRRRDARAIITLRRKGFRVALIWECEQAEIDSRLRQIFESRGVNS